MAPHTLRSWIKNLGEKWTKGARSRRWLSPARARNKEMPKARPALESLEGRIVPTTITSSTALLPVTATSITIAGSGFSNSPSNDIIFWNANGEGNVSGSVTSATTTSLTASLTNLSSLTSGQALVINFEVTSPFAFLSNVEVAVVSSGGATLAASSAALPLNATSLTIAGSGFDATTANDIVSFNNGITGTVTTATSSSLTASVTGLGNLKVGTVLDASVTVDGNAATNDPASASETQIGTVAPVVTPNATTISAASSTLTIDGLGFDTNTANDSVTFNNGVTGKVTAATSTTLTVSVTGLSYVPNGTALTASATVDMVSSGTAVEVADVKGGTPVINGSSSTLIPAGPTVLTLSGSGFDSSNTANDSITFNNGVTGSVTSVNNVSPSQGTITVSVTGLGSVPLGTVLNATVTVDGDPSSQTAIGTVVPAITANSTNLADTSTSITISGYGFDSTHSGSNTVTFNDNVSGIVTAATSSTLTVSLTGLSSVPGNTPLTASVTVDGVSSGPGVEVANVVPQAPTVTPNTTNNVVDTSTTLTITGTNFSPTTSSDSVSFNLGVTGTVTSATATQLTVTIATPPTALGALTAVVTAGGASSGAAVQVATETNSDWNVTDSNGGGSPSLTDITLPYAVAHALNGDTITFASSLSGDTITLSSALTVGSNVTITGLGANELAVSGGGAVTVFNIPSGVTAIIQGLTIENGYAPVTPTNGGGTVGSGGGVYNSGTLTLSNDTVYGNNANAQYGHGGGIYNVGTMTIYETSVDNNSAARYGGGVFNTSSGTLSVVNSTIAGNDIGYGSGAGIDNQGSLNLTNSTITGNSGGFSGGISGGGKVTMSNTIVAYNKYHYSGGSPDIAGSVTAYNSLIGNTTGTTITDSTNTTNILNASAGLATSLANNGGPTQTFALLAGSPAIGTGGAVTTAPSISSGVYTFSVANAAMIAQTGSGYNIPIFIGTSAVNEQLTVIAVNTAANTLTVSTAVVGTYSGTTSVFLATDQRSVVATIPPDIGAYNTGAPTGPPPTVSAVSPATGPATGGTTVTITGTNFTNATAVFFDSTAATSFTVTSATSITAVDPAEVSGTADVTVTTSTGGTSTTSSADQFVYTPPVYIVTSADGNLADGSATDVTLPWAVSQGPDIIEFAPSLADDVIVLTGTLDITTNVDIVGLGANLLAVSGNGQARDFLVSSGVTASISGLTIEGGGPPPSTVGFDDADYGSGGGISNSGTLTLSNDAVSNNNYNTQFGKGGGIYNNGVMTIYDSTVANNTVDGRYGGGVFNDTNGTLSIVNSTISGNSAWDSGGGISNNGSLNLTNSTITGNTSGGWFGWYGYVGGLAAGGKVTMTNTIVAGNTAHGAQDISGNVTAYSSLIGNTSGGYAFFSNVNGVTITNSTTTNILNTSAGLAASLANNGGPTQTFALLAGSPAIGTGGAITTVTASASAGATTLSVVNAAAIASTPGQYYIVIDGQELEVTNVSLSTNTLALANGIPAAINSGDSVYLFSDQQGVIRNSTPDIGAYEYAVGVNPNTGNLPATAATILISGSLFDPNPANDSVTFNQTVDSGVTGTVIYATTDYLAVSLNGLNSSLIGQALDVTVTADGLASASVQVATVVAPATIPSVTFSNTTVPDSSVTLTIDGTNFDTTNPSNNSVVFTSLGVTGAVTAVNSAGTQLTVTLYTSPTALGALYASVTTDGISSGSPVEVATIGSGTWAVTTSASSGGPSNVSLPYAVAHAQNGDTITFADVLTGGNTISLISTLTLNNSVAITDEAQNVTVSGNDAVQDFSVSSGATASIIGLTIENGVGSVVSGGGGINNAGTLTLENATVSNNGAYGHVSYSGGGIHNTGTLTIYDSTVNNNTAAFSNGGGIYNASSGTLSISNSTIYGNTFGSHGGGIYNAGSLTLSNSTITGNTTFVYYGGTYGLSGGGIYNKGTVTMSNTVVAGNSLGVYVARYDIDSAPSDISGSVTAFNSLIGNTSGVTITDSTTTNILGSSADLATSLANNGGPTQTVALLPGSPAIGAGGALTTVTAGATITNTATTNLQVGDGAAIASTSGQYYITIDGVEMVVTAVSGNTLTVENVTAATVTVSANDGVYLATDQRGDAAASPPDIGAYTYFPAPTVTLNTINSVADSSTTLTITGTNFSTATGSDSVSFNLGLTGTVSSATSTQLIVTVVTPPTALGSLTAVVTVGGSSSGAATQVATETNGDWLVTDSSGGGSPSLTDITLPYAVAHSLNGDTIDFASSLSGDTITLSSALTVGSNVTITGLGANELAVSGNNAVRVFTISSGVTASITGLTIEDGNAAIAGSGHATGGGVFNSGTLTLANDAVSENNSNVQYGIAGGVYNAGTMTIYDSTVDKNSAAGRYGGGVYNNNTGTLSIVNSTISGNDAYFNGGGILNQGTLNLTNSTITGNGGSYSNGAGGISAGGTVTMINTIVAYNTSNDGPADISGTVTAYNSLIGNTSGVTITDSSNTTNILNSSAGLATSLANNGGPTETVALLEGSPAFEAGGAITTVTVGASIGAATITVNNAAAIASTPGQYYIVIDAAELEVTNVNLSTNTLTLANGIPAAINSGDSVYLFSDQRGVIRKPTPDIGAYEYAVGVNPNTGNLPTTAATILISGSLFDPNPANDSVTFNQTVDPGVTGKVIYATANYLGVSLSGLNSSLIGQALDATVTADGLASASVQVATIIAPATIPSVTFAGTVPDSSVTLTIDGTDFDTTNPSNNSVVFTSLGVTGTVTAVNSTGTQLTVTLSTSPTGLGALYASVTTDGISSGSPVEVASIGSGTWVVTTSASSGGSPSNVTLPYAVAYAQNGDTITFANDLTGGNTITLSSTLTLDNSVAITDAAQNVTVSGNNAVQVFSVSSAATASIAGLTVEGGMASAGGGGGINNAGMLTLTNATVSNNNAGYYSYVNGGGIFNKGTLTIYDSTVSSNTALSNGGGIYNASSGTLTIANSTIYGNSYYTNGGGIYNAGSLNLSNSTITGNTSVNYYGIWGEFGGGIFNAGTGTVTMSNTIVAGNVGIYGGPDIDGSVTAYNSIIGNTTNLTITDSTNTTNILNASAGLATSLANNGGPTQTVALLPGSPAIGAGGAVTTVADPIGVNDTTIVLQNAAAIAVTPGAYTITIGQEEMLVTGVSGNTLTVQRGYDNTTPEAYSPGTGVYLATDQRGVTAASPPDIGAYTVTATSTPTTTTLTANGPDPSLSGTNVSFTVSVSGVSLISGEQVTIEDVTGGGDTVVATPTLINGTATFTLSSLSVGTHQLEAFYATDVTNAASNSNEVTQTVQSTFGVDSVAATPDGVVLTFNAPINANTTVLYSSPGETTLGAADVSVVGPGNTTLRGSLIIDPTDPFVATFVQTSGLLAPGTYTVTVTSAVKAVSGSAMSGNYSSTFTVTSTTTPVLSAPSFARGPGQTVALTDSVGNSPGIPISISNATDVTQVGFSLTFDPQLLTIASSGALSLSSAAKAAGLVIQSYTITPADANHSVLTVTISGGTGFTVTTATRLLTILASVPTTAPYLDKEVLDFSSVQVNGANATGVSSVAVVAYPGDVLGDGLPNATDASLVDQVASGSGTGFSVFKDLDPAIIGGVDGGPLLNANDASLIDEAASGASVAQIPLIPVGVSLTLGGPDPYLYLSAVQGAPGQTVTETLYLDVTDPNGIQLTALDEAIGFDASTLQISDVRGTSALMALGSYDTASTVDNGSGEFLVAQAFMGTGLPPVIPYGTDIPVLEFNVTLNADMGVGSETGLTLLQYGTVNNVTQYTAISDNEGALIWTPGKAPSNSGNAAVDGSVTVTAATTPAEAVTVGSTSPGSAVVSPKVVEPVRRATPVKAPSAAAAPTLATDTSVATSSNLIVITAPTGELVVVTNVGPVQPSSLATMQSDVNLATGPMMVSPMLGLEAVQSASVVSGESRIGDSGASLSLAALSTNRVASVVLPESSSVKSSTNVLDEMYRQLGTILGVPSGYGYTLGASGEESSEEVDGVWDLEEYLSDRD